MTPGIRSISAADANASSIRTGTGALRHRRPRTRNQLRRVAAERGLTAQRGTAALGADLADWASVVFPDPGSPERVLAEYKERMGVGMVAWNPRYSLRLEHRLQRVQSPAQVLVPEEDGLTAPSIARRYSELLDAPLVTISSAARATQHLVVLQEPGRVAEQVARDAGSRPVAADNQALGRVPVRRGAFSLAGRINATVNVIGLR